MTNPTEERLREIDARVSPYVLDRDQKRALLNKISVEELHRFLQRRDAFIFAARKADIIDRMLQMSFDLEQMKQLMRLAGNR